MKELDEQIKITKEVIEGRHEYIFATDEKALILRNQLVMMEMLKELYSYRPGFHL